MTKLPLYLYTTFTRSIDNYHKINDIIHLISSVFYCDELITNYSRLTKYHHNSKYIYIFHFNFFNLHLFNNLDTKDFSFLSPYSPTSRIYDNKLIEIKIDMSWFFISYYLSPYSRNNEFELFLLELTSELSPSNNELTKNNILNNCYFIFEQTNWVSLQIIFRSLNIDLSGGSTSRRHLLSTADVHLSIFLNLLGIKIDSVYKSSILHKNWSYLNEDIISSPKNSGSALTKGERYSLRRAQSYLYSNSNTQSVFKDQGPISDSSEDSEFKLDNNHLSDRMDPNVFNGTIPASNTRRFKTLKAAQTILIPITFYKFLIILKRDRWINLLSNDIIKFEKDISDLRNNISSIEKNKIAKANKRAKNKSSIDLLLKVRGVDDEVIYKLSAKEKKHIALNQDKILKIQDNILLKKNEITGLTNYIEDLLQTSDDKIKSFYINEMHTESKTMSPNNRHKLFSKKLLAATSSVENSPNDLLGSDSLNREPRALALVSSDLPREEAIENSNHGHLLAGDTQERDHRLISLKENGVENLSLSGVNRAKSSNNHSKSLDIKKYSTLTSLKAKANYSYPLKFLGEGSLESEENLSNHCIYSKLKQITDYPKSLIINNSVNTKNLSSLRERSAMQFRVNRAPILSRGYWVTTFHLNDLHWEFGFDNLRLRSGVNWGMLPRPICVNRKNMSIYSNQSIVSDYLMKILYSDDSKENIQRNIEHYLISQQNNILLKNIGDTKLNYKLVNPIIVDILIESKFQIQQLYLNIKSHLKNMSENDVDFFSLNILSTLACEKIINIIYGKVLVVISNNNVYNKYTNLTDVSYELGKEVINQYNYHLYLLNRKKEPNQTFSQFMLTAQLKEYANSQSKLTGSSAQLVSQAQTQDQAQDQYQDQDQDQDQYQHQTQTHTQTQTQTQNQLNSAGSLGPLGKLSFPRPLRKGRLSEVVKPEVIISPSKMSAYLQDNDNNLSLTQDGGNIRNNLKWVITDLDDPTKIVGLGSILIGWLLEIKLLSKKIVFYSKNEKRNMLLAGDKINKYLNKQDNKSLINLPVKLPMVCKPKLYFKSDDHGTSINNGCVAISISISQAKVQEDTVHYGGFLLNDELYAESLIIDKPHLAFKSSLSKNNIIYKLVDNINSVPFAINQEVLDFITKNYKTFDLLIDPEYIHPLESKSFQKLTLSEKKELESFKSKLNLESEILNIAQIFRNSSELYIPVRLDYRGRIYCNVEYFHYQSVELAKSLLKFAKGEKVSLNDEVSIKFLKIFGANCYGNTLDKSSFNDRITWIDQNIENIIHFANGKLISKAENKLLFIAFCFEFNKYLDAVNNHEDSFITHLPIQLDASCNGFQHLSLLLEDTTLAKQVNLSSSTWKNVPDDFYTFLSLKIKEYLIEELNQNKDLDVSLKNSYIKLSQLDFHNHRSLVKKTIMTIPYNSTKYANIMDMKEEFNYIQKDGEYIYKKDKNIKFQNIDFQVICNTLYLCLYRDFPKLEGLLNYFKTIAKISNRLGISIPWNLPTGLNVKQKYYGTKKIKFKPFIYSKDLLNLNIIDKNSTNSRKQIRSLMPNLVHSLDAASLSLLIHNFFKEENSNNFYSIHDCFAVTCNNVHLIYELLKLSYYNIYCNESFLLTFDRNFKESIVTQFGENAYSKETNEITVINDEGEKLILPYPNIHEVFKPEKLNFMNSSYFIG